MLQTLPRENVTQDVHRFANLEHVGVFAQKKGLTIEQVTEVIGFLRDDVTKELMEGPFQRKPFFGNKFGPPSRFSNGEWPVFYAAIGSATAKEESKYHYARKAAGDEAARRGVRYSIIRCKFSGEIVDLLPKLDDWQDLISDDNYTFCNDLGKEAHDVGVGGFFAPSARNRGGTTVPAFIQGIISDPVIEATAKLTFDEGETMVEVQQLP
jgi:RES domain